VFLTVAAVSRKRLRTIVPLLIVVAVAIAGEVVDMRDDLSSLGHWRWEASLHDVLNTLFWPTVIWLLARSDFLFTRRAAETGLSEEPRNRRYVGLS
jgi:hypothetical protein